ncbi:pilin [Patescibacteria group bacterium]|nr:pilin [Patescibacteria group bacterium]
MRLLKKSFAFLLPLLVLAVPLIVGAERLENPLGQNTTLTVLLERVLQLAIQIGFPILVVYIVYIGFQFVQAEGNPDKLKQVRSNFFWALVGGVILLGASALATAIRLTVEQLGATNP